MAAAKKWNTLPIAVFVRLVVFSAFAVPVAAATLRPATIEAWDEYVRLTEQRISGELSSQRGFLAKDFLDPQTVRSCEELLKSGGVCVLDMTETSKIDVPDGRIHHWLGTTLIPGARLDEVIDWIQQYDRHQEFYDDVEQSRLIFRDGDFFQIFLRLKRTKILTVHYNTNHDVTYYRRGKGRLYSSSIATRIREIENAGTAQEREKPEGQDNGFLWRLNSYWRYEETPKGVIVECESLSLSRDVPALLFMIESIVDSTAREALQYTLGNLKDGFLAESSSPGE